MSKPKRYTLTSILSNVTGMNVVDVEDGYDYYNVVIESDSTQTYTLKRKVVQGTKYVSFESNTMTGDSSITFYLPGTDSFQITPSSTDEYTVIVTVAGGNK